MPTPDPDHYWPSCDDQPGVSIRPLREADLAAILARLNQHHRQAPGDDALGPGGPAPVLAVRVRASVGQAGASAHAQYRRRRAIEWAAWTRSLPWRAAAILAGGLGVGLVAAQLLPPLAGLAGLLAAACLAWALRFRATDETLAWRRGATGERHTARLLAPLERRGWAVLHDLAIPGSQVNIDCLVIGPGGVAVIDSKHYRGGCGWTPLGCCGVAASCCP
jgi:Nuclease-related domain